MSTYDPKRTSIRMAVKIGAQWPPWIWGQMGSAAIRALSRRPARSVLISVNDCWARAVTIQRSNGAGASKVLLRIVALHLIAGLLTAPLAAQPSSRSVLLLDQSSAGLPLIPALATAVRLTLSAESKVPISFYARISMHNRFFGFDYEEGVLASFSRKKYRDKTINVVVVIVRIAVSLTSLHDGGQNPTTYL